MRIILALILLLLPFQALSHGNQWMDAYVGPTPYTERYETPYYDVDTLFLTIDMDFMGLRWYGPVRIYCIDGAEIRPLKTREIATIQRDFGASLAPEHTRVKVRWYGKGKFGRPIIEMLIGGLNYGAVIINEFPETVTIEAYNPRMFSACREILGLEPLEP